MKEGKGRKITRRRRKKKKKKKKKNKTRRRTRTRRPITPQKTKKKES